MNTVCLVQARLTSDRLPNKVLLPIGGYEILYHVVRRCELAADTTVIIPDTGSNDPLAAWLDEHQIPFLRGPEDDVLGRYYLAATHLRADRIIRVTADCPLIDPDEITRLLERVGFNRNPLYCSNIGIRMLPRGLDCEVFTRRMLIQAHKAATQPYDREHVTPWMMRQCSEHLEIQGDGGDLSFHRWVVDTKDDYAWFRLLASEVDFTPPYPTTDQVLAFLNNHMEYVHHDN